MDIFCEYMVKRKKTGKDILMCAGCILAAIILSLAVILLLFGRIMGLEVFVIFGLWYGAVFLIRKTDVEYEYILTNSILDIDKIMAKKSRKRVASIDFKSIEECAPAESVTADSGAKVLDFTSNASDGGIYKIVSFKDSVKQVVYFQPNAKILKNIKSINPRLVNVREEDMQ